MRRPSVLHNSPPITTPISLWPIATLSAASSTPTSTRPQAFPSPTQPPPDLVTPAFEHMLAFGELRELSEEELARAVKIDPSQIAGLGPTLESLKAALEERKRKILQTYETEAAQKSAADKYRETGEQIAPPKKLRDRFRRLRRRTNPRPGALWYATATTIRPLPISSSNSSIAWATNTKSTNSLPNTISPAARRWIFRKLSKSRKSLKRSTAY